MTVWRELLEYYETCPPRGQAEHDMGCRGTMWKSFYWLYYFMIVLKTLACRKLTSSRPKTNDCVLINTVFALFSCARFVNLALSQSTGMGIILDSGQKDCRNKQTKTTGYGRHIYHFSTQAMKVGGSEVQGQFQLLGKYKVNLGHQKSCQKRKENNSRFELKEIVNIPLRDV